MKRQIARFLFLLQFLIPHPLKAEDWITFSEPPRLNAFDKESTVSTNVKGVSIVSGSYHCQETDLIVPGPELLKFTRTYNGRGGSSDFGSGSLYADWSCNHSSAIVVQRNPNKGFKRLSPQVGGNIYLYNLHLFNLNWHDDFFTEKPGKYDGSYLPEQGLYADYGWTCSNEPSARSHPKNAKVFFDRQTDTLSLHKDEQQVFTKVAGFHTFYHPCVSYFLKNIKKTSGNEIHYNFNGHKSRLPLRVETKNNAGQVMNWLKLSNHSPFDRGKRRGAWSVDIEASNGQKLVYTYEWREKAGKPRLQLEKVESSLQPTTKYSYHIHNHLKEISKGNKPLLELNYNEVRKNEFRVSKLLEPVGKNGEKIAVYNFIYKEDEGHLNWMAKPGNTSVVDANGHKSVYYYDEYKRLKKIESPEKTELFFFDESKKNYGNFLCKALQDPKSGKIIAAWSNYYDERGNILEQRVWGNLSGQCEKEICLNKNGQPKENGVEYDWTKYCYNKNDLMIAKLENSGKETLYYYLGNSDRLEKVFLCFNGEIYIRQFYEYDEFGNLIRNIVDDGKSKDKNNLKDLRERKIFQSSYSRDMGSFGLPISEEQLYLDLSSKKEKLFQKTLKTYDLKGQLIKEEVYDANGKKQYQIERSYNDKSLVTKELDSRGKSYSFEYDESLNKVRSLGPDNFETRFFYDAANRLIAEEKTHGKIKQKTCFEYDAMGNKTASINELGNRSEMQYDAYGRLIQSIEPLVLDENKKSYFSIKNFEYDPLDNASRIIDANGEVIEKTHNINGLITSTIFADKSKESCLYDLSGNLIKKTEKNGSVTHYQYDFIGREISARSYDRKGRFLKETKKSYSAFHMVSSTDEMGVTSHFEYNSQGKLCKESIEDRQSLFFYDAMGNLNCICKKNNGQDRFEQKQYDAYQRLIEERTEDGQGRVYRKTNYAYDLFDNCTLEDKAGSKSHYQYDAWGRLRKKTNALGKSSVFEYSMLKNALGQNVWQIKETDALKRCTKSTMDSMQRVSCVQKLNAKGQVLDQKNIFYDRASNKALEEHIVYENKQYLETKCTKWVYGPANLLKRLIEGHGKKITEYEYDKASRLCTIIKPDGVKLLHGYNGFDKLQDLRSSDNSIHYEYSYDAKERLILAKDLLQGTSVKRSFDAFDALVSEEGEHCLSYNYDKLGRLCKLQLPDDSCIEFAYNVANLIAVKRNGMEHQYLAHDLCGNALEEKLFNESLVKYSYDALQRKVACQHPLESWKAQEFDALGNLISLLQNGPEGNVLSHYDYDELNQLQKEEGLFDNGYCYDSRKNRRHKNDAPYQINKLDQLLSDESAYYVFDANGNPTEKNISGQKCHYRYDALGRLISIEENNHKSIYTYDSFNRRTKKQGYINNELVKEEHYLQRDQEELAIIKDGRISHLRIFAGQAKPSIAVEIDGELLPTLHNVQGSISCLLDPKESQAKEYFRYSAFGEEKLYNGDGKIQEHSTCPWRFFSKHTDPESGLVYFGRRYYQPTNGRWLSPDPAGFIDGPNLYAYVHNNPLIYYDLYGLWTEDDTWLERTLEVSEYTLIGIDLICLATPEPVVSKASAAGAASAAAALRAIRFAQKAQPIKNVALKSRHIKKLTDIKPLAAIKKALSSLWTKTKAPNASLKTIGKPEAVKDAKTVSEKVLRPRIKPDLSAEGAHSVFRRDPLNGKINKYETFQPQTNHKNPNPWESVIRYDGTHSPHEHFNKITRQDIHTPHIHDPKTPGGIRKPKNWEQP